MTWPSRRDLAEPERPVVQPDGEDVSDAYFTHFKDAFCDATPF